MFLPDPIIDLILHYHDFKPWVHVPVSFLESENKLYYTGIHKFEGSRRWHALRSLQVPMRDILDWWDEHDIFVEMERTEQRWYQITKFYTKKNVSPARRNELDKSFARHYYIADKEFGEMISARDFMKDEKMSGWEGEETTIPMEKILKHLGL